MNVEIKWLEQKLTLLKAHLREVKASLLTEKKDREALIEGHQRQINLPLNSKDLFKMAALEAKQAKAIAELARHYIAIRKVILIRQREEEIALQEQIDLERDNYSKNT
jgi:hypothetical protein